MPSFKNVQITITTNGESSCKIKASVELTVSAAEAAATDTAKHFVVFLFFRADNNKADFTHTVVLSGARETTFTFSKELIRPLAKSAIVNPRLEVKVFALNPTPKLHNNLVVGGAPVSFIIP